MNASVELVSRMRTMANTLLLEAEKIEATFWGAGVACAEAKAPSNIQIKAMRPRFIEFAKLTYRRRAKRGNFIEEDLLGEPAWDMLLDLYVKTLEGEKVAVSSACIASNSPSTTGLRYLSVLTSLGFVHRGQSPTDRRTVLVWLTDEAILKLDRYFFSIINAAPTAPAACHTLESDLGPQALRPIDKLDDQFDISFPPLGRGVRKFKS